MRNIDKYLKKYNQGKNGNTDDFHASRIILAKLANFFRRVCYSEMKYSEQGVESLLRKVEEINPELFGYLKARN